MGVIDQNQVNRLVSNPRKRGIKVTAFHDHWLNETPRLMYLHRTLFRGNGPFSESSESTAVKPSQKRDQSNSRS
ncbi:DUF1259 domain-containing protein [Paenibacillus agaridevorans]|uniref:DUF1259 domain-containing protein n=1 Tax=Paenibacillus agaridevorans TaxID=171404 RepID=UPI001BE49F4F